MSDIMIFNFNSWFFKITGNDSALCYHILFHVSVSTWYVRICERGFIRIHSQLTGPIVRLGIVSCEDESHSSQENVFFQRPSSDAFHIVQYLWGSYDNDFRICFDGYRKIIAQYVAKWAIAHISGRAYSGSFSLRSIIIKNVVINFKRSSITSKWVLGWSKSSTSSNLIMLASEACIGRLKEFKASSKLISTSSWGQTFKSSMRSQAVEVSIMNETIIQASQTVMTVIESPSSKECVKIHQCLMPSWLKSGGGRRCKLRSHHIIVLSSSLSVGHDKES